MTEQHWIWKLFENTPSGAVEHYETAQDGEGFSVTFNPAAYGDNLYRAGHRCELIGGYATVWEAMTACADRLGVEAIHGWVPPMLDTGATAHESPTAIRMF